MLKLEDAKHAGAQLAFGGTKLDGPGAYISAGILTDGRSTTR